MLEAEAEAGAELAGELSGDTLESKFLALESGGHGSEEDALAELKAKMGLLESGTTTETRQLTAGDERAASADNGASSATADVGLSAEDLKELEDLDLSGLDLDDLDETSKDDTPEPAA
jgi:hypothetical protein